MAAKRSGFLISLRPGSPLRAVSSWTITSGSVSATAPATASGSTASATTGQAPRARSMSVLAGDRVMAITSWPAAASRGTSWVPIAPVAPATNTFMGASFPIHLRADTSRDKTALLPVTQGLRVCATGLHSAPRRSLADPRRKAAPAGLHPTHSRLTGWDGVGPPGTGKTFAIAAVVAALASQVEPRTMRVGFTTMSLAVVRPSSSRWAAALRSSAAPPRLGVRRGRRSSLRGRRGSRGARRLGTSLRRGRPRRAAVARPVGPLPVPQEARRERAVR